MGVAAKDLALNFTYIGLYVSFVPKNKKMHHFSFLSNEFVTVTVILGPIIHVRVLWTWHKSNSQSCLLYTSDAADE